MIKLKARHINLFSGQPSKGQAMLRKIDELVFRVNHPEYYGDDLFLLFMHLLCVYYPCCSDEICIRTYLLLQIVKMCARVSERREYMITTATS